MGGSDGYTLTAGQRGLFDESVGRGTIILQPQRRDKALSYSLEVGEPLRFFKAADQGFAVAQRRRKVTLRHACLFAPAFEQGTKGERVATLHMVRFLYHFCEVFVKKAVAPGRPTGRVDARA